MPSPEFASVSSDEIAFAFTLFFEAANRRVSIPEPPSEALSESQDEVCRELYRTLIAEVLDEPSAKATPSGEPTSLFYALRAVCRHYALDPLQAAICARVLAFCFLMERTAGAALAGWVKEHPEMPEVVSLHPAVIEAIASVPLRGSVLLVESRFLELVAEKAAAKAGQQPF